MPINIAATPDRHQGVAGNMSRPDTSVSLSGGGAAAKAAQVFRRMDNDNNGALDFSEMLQALKELGVLDGIQAAEASKVLQKELREADTDHDGLIDFQEFQHYFQRMALYQQNEARKQRLKRKTAPSGADRNPVLKSCFRQFCHYGKAHVIGAGSMTNVSLESLRMNSRQFQRLCRDVGFVHPGGELEPMTVDIIFAQCKVAGDRSINFKGFLEALSMIADDLDASFDGLTAFISQHTQVSETDKEASPNGTRRKSATLKRPQTASIVAQAWKKTSDESIEPRSPPENSRSWSANANSLSTGNLQTMLQQAREEGAKQATLEWDEERRQLQAHLQQLQDVIATLQESQDHETWPSRTEPQSGPKERSKMSANEMDALRASIMEDIQQRIDFLGTNSQLLQGQKGDKASPMDESAVNRLRLQVVQLEDVVSHLQETQSSFNSTGSGTMGMSTETAPVADLEEAVQALEERALERQKRLEAAMLQIACKMDALEQRVNALT